MSMYDTLSDGFKQIIPFVTSSITEQCANIETLFLKCLFSSISTSELKNGNLKKNHK